MDTGYRDLYELKPRPGSGILYAHFKGTGRRLSGRSRNEAEAHAHLKALISGTDTAPKPSLLVDFAADFFDPEKCEWLKRQKKKGKRFGLSNQPIEPTEPQEHADQSHTSEVRTQGHREPPCHRDRGLALEP